MNVDVPFKIKKYRGTSKFIIALVEGKENNKKFALIARTNSPIVDIQEDWETELCHLVSCQYEPIILKGYSGQITIPMKYENKILYSLISIENEREYDLIGNTLEAIL